MNYLEMYQQIDEQNQLAQNWTLVAIIALSVSLIWQSVNAIYWYKKNK